MNNTEKMKDLHDFLMEMPSKVDVLVPTMVLITLILIGIIVLHVSSRPKSSGVREAPKTNTWKTKSSRVWVDPDNSSGGNHKHQSQPPELFTCRDLQIIERYNQFPNSFLPLLCVSMPALLSLLFCPLTLFSTPHVVHAFWPKDLFPVRPNINDAVSCFLMPAGLVYAIAFGFAMQNTMNKNGQIATDFRNGVKCLRELLCITMLVKRLAPTTKIAVLVALKDATIALMEDMISHRKTENMNQEKHVWRLSDVIQADPEAPGAQGKLDHDFISEMASRIISLESLLADGGFSTTGKIAWMQWLFLELLGFVSFFGVLLVKGSSYLLELTICMLTVFTISLFCYILADMDEPFHGMFRMDISSLSDLLYTIQENHQQLTEDTAKQAVSVAVNVTDIVDAKE